MCLYQTPGRCPPPITGRLVNTVTRGWVRAPNRRAPFRFHGAVVGFVDRCLSRTRNLAASNKHFAEFFSGRSWPKIGPGFSFSGFLKSLKLFFTKICAHSKRYRNLLAGIFEILTFCGNITFPLSPVLQFGDPTRSPRDTQETLKDPIFSRALRVATLLFQINEVCQ